MGHPYSLRHSTEVASDLGLGMLQVRPGGCTSLGLTLPVLRRGREGWGTLHCSLSTGYSWRGPYTALNCLNCCGGPTFL